MADSFQIIEYIKATWSREEFPAKIFLVKEGASAKKIFYIETGSCRCWFDAGEAKEITMNFGFDGSFVSSMETFKSSEPCWYNVETLEPTVAYSILLSEFEEKKLASPDLQKSYCEYLERRLWHYQKLFISRIKDSPEKRYRELLRHHPEIITRVPQHYIASFLGITSVSLSRIRNRK